MSFSKFTCVQCIRRLSRLAESSKSLSNPILPQAAPQLSHSYKPLFATRRYGTRLVGRAIVTRDAFAIVRFTRADVPPREFWEQQVREPLVAGVADLSADECLQAAQAYTDAALKKTPDWRDRLIVVSERPIKSSGKDRQLSAYTLHWVAVLMVMDLTRAGGQAGHLAMHILYTLSSLGYTPSTLTMVRFALERNLIGSPQFEPAIEKLKRIVDRIGDSHRSSKSAQKSRICDFAADACTLRALIYEKENTPNGDTNALRWFRRAYELGQRTSSATDQVPSATDQVPSAADQVPTPFNPHWQWKKSFALGAGRIRMKQGDLNRARDMYAIASSELDDAEGYMAMADVLEKLGEADTEKYVEYLQKAAISGNLEAVRKMGEREKARATERGLSEWERRKRRVVAKEWMAIASYAGPCGQVSRVSQKA
ncbi:hypothetical protein F5Y09DRAFT_354907 [Xylaria sp. FL1042]|nr:hypothetical protein F5Y09DRAFT_354907 [Xylaria sp. FL1042]